MPHPDDLIPQIVENTVIISNQTAKKLFEAKQSFEGAGEYAWYSLKDVSTKGVFNLQNAQGNIISITYEPWLIDTLCTAKVKGDICFAHICENSSGLWGHRFNGKGGVKTLCGDFQWKTLKS